MKDHEGLQEIKSQIVGVEGIQVFKIFGLATFSYQDAHAPSTVDWSGFYTQYTPQHSMRYLTKKWGDGSTQASLLAIRPKKRAHGDNQNMEIPIRIIRVAHSILGKHSVSGEIKAKMIKQHLCNKYQMDFGENLSQPLIGKLGQIKMLFQCVDSEDEEIVIPHDLFNSSSFQVNGVAVFRCSSDGMLRTLSWRPYAQKADWRSVKGQEQFQPHLLVDTCQQIKKLLNDMGKKWV